MNLINALTKKLKPCDECLKKKRSITKLLLIARFKEKDGNYFETIPLDIFKLLLSYAREITHQIIVSVGDYMNLLLPKDLYYMPCSSTVMCLRHLIASRVSAPPSNFEVFIIKYDQMFKLVDNFELVGRKTNEFFIHYIYD